MAMRKKQSPIVQKRYFWGHKSYNLKTGLYKGDKTYHSDGTVTDWKGRETKE